MVRGVLGILLPVFIIGGLVACTGDEGGNETALQEARTGLEGYFSALAAGNYAEAASWYGGSYEVLVDYNPDVDVQDQAALLERACTVNGFVCLPLEQVEPMSGATEEQVQFQVQFQNPDGSLFVLGPCCGAKSEEMPPQSTFEVLVQRSADGRFLVMDLPVYQP